MVRIRATYGTPEFMREYHAAIAGHPVTTGTRGAARGTLQWLIDQYRTTTAWASLKPATRRQRENIFRHIVASAGDALFAEIDQQTIRRGMDKRRDRPAAAKHFRQTLRGLFIWAVEAGHMDVDPTQGVRRIRERTDGHRPWTRDDIAAYRVRWPLGTMQRLAFEVLLQTGLRRGDAVRLGRQHMRDGVIRLRTEKTGTEMACLITPELAEAISAGPVGDMVLIVGTSGKPRTAASFGNEFRGWCDAAGLSGLSAHGLRKAAATLDAERGATDRQLMAKFGWTSSRIATVYTRAADIEALARGIGAPKK